MLQVPAIGTHAERLSQQTGKRPGGNIKRVDVSPKSKEAQENPTPGRSEESTGEGVRDSQTAARTPQDGAGPSQKKKPAGASDGKKPSGSKPKETKKAASPLKKVKDDKKDPAPNCTAAAGSESIVAASRATEQEGKDPDLFKRWWVHVLIGEYKLKALYDPGSTITLLNGNGLQIVKACGAVFVPAMAGKAKLA